MNKSKKTIRRNANRRGSSALPSSVVSLSALPQSWDTGAAGKANRMNIVIETETGTDPETGKPLNPNGIIRARRVDMLEVWHRKGDISTAGYNAAESLRNAFEKTQMGKGVDYSAVRVDSSPKPDHAVTIMIGRLSAFHAYAQFISEYDRAIIDCCVLSAGTPAYLRIDGQRPYYGRGYQDGLDHLRDALDRLAHATG